MASHDLALDVALPGRANDGKTASSATKPYCLFIHPGKSNKGTKAMYT